MSRNKLISIVCTLALLVGFFCVDNTVNAENTYIRNIRTYSGYKSAASLTYSATACQFHYNSDTSLTGGIYSPVLITVRFTNNGSNDVKIANSYVDLTFTTSANVQRFDCYTSDLMVQVAGTAGQHTPRYNIIGGDGFSYNGHIVVPHNSSIYLVFEVDIAGNINTSSGQPEGPGLDAVFVSVADSDVQTGEFVTGIIPRQLDQIDTLLSNLYSSQAAATSQLQIMYGDVHTLLTDIKNQINFTGTYTIPTSEVVSTKTTSYTNADQPGITYSLRALKYPSYLISYDFEENNYTDQIDAGGYKRIVYQFNIIMYNPSPVKFSSMVFYLPIPYGTRMQCYIADINTNVFDHGFVLEDRLTLSGSIRDPDTDSASRYLIPAGYNYAYLTLYLDVPINTSVGNVSDFVSTPVVLYGYSPYSGYVPFSVSSGISDIYQAITSPSQQNTNTGNASDEAADLSDDIHEQEQVWYDQNSAAMEAVGLSSYRFTNQQASGILGVTTQFEQLWLSLGNWTLIYIFVLMLSLATFIIRHEPSTRVKQMREQYNTDREVRLGWERINNPDKAHYRQLVERHRR